MSRSILQYFTEQDNTDSTIPDPQEEKKGFISRTISSFLKKAPEVAKDAMKKTEVGQKITTRNDMMARINAGKD